MDELQKDFLNQSIADLENLDRQLRDENFSENALREAFRTLHTIKGTAQVFGFGNIGGLAHEIENLLAVGRDKKIPADKNFRSLLLEGTSFLTEMLQQRRANEETSFPKIFVEKLRLVTKNDASVKDFSFHLPREILAQLSKDEKDSIDAAIENGKNFYIIEVGFDFANFDGEFKNFRNVLSEAGAIAATCPSFNFPQKIGFQVFFVTEKSSPEVGKIVSPFNAEINFKLEKNQTVFGNYLEAVLSQAVDGAKKLSDQFGKRIEFDVLLAEAEVPVKRLKDLFDILLHLTRNAIDHGIEKTGKITIRLESNGSGLHLTVADDGRGIDLEKVKAEAIEKNLIAPGAPLSEEEIRRLIFRYGFSTSKTVSEVSGRGVGLDTVEDLVKKANGKIDVFSRMDEGTRFEIFLPNEEAK